MAATTDEQDNEETQRERNVFLLEAVGWKRHDVNVQASASILPMWLPPIGMPQNFYRETDLPVLSSREAACYREDLLKHLLSLGWAIDDLSQNTEAGRFEIDMRCWDGYGEDAILKGQASGRGATYEEAFLSAAYQALEETT